MRLSQLAFLLLISYCVQGQTPAGLANTFDLSETSGFSGKYYVSFFKHTKSGKIYVKDNFGGVNIIGNNFSKSLHGYKPYIVNSHITEVGQELWIFDDSRSVVIVKNDSVAKVLKDNDPRIPAGVHSYNNRSFYFRTVEGGLDIYEHKINKWTLIKRLQLPPNIAEKDIDFIAFKKDVVVLGVLGAKGIHHMYHMDTVQWKLQYVKSVSQTEFGYFVNLYSGNWDNYVKLKGAFAVMFEKHIGKPLQASFLKDGWSEGHFNKMIGDADFVFLRSEGILDYLSIEGGKIKSVISFETKNHNHNVIKNPYYPYLTALTGYKTFRIFPYVKKYPRIYDEDNSNNIFIITQDNKGRIWAGSYNKGLSIINNDSHVVALQKQPYAFMDAALNYNGKIYLVGETGTGGVLQYNMKGIMRKVLPRLATGYYLYLAPKSKKVYYPSAEGPDHAVYYCDAKEIEKRIVPWKKLDSKLGINPISFRTVTEDTLGRIWMGHPKKGFAVYNPKLNRGTTYETSKQQSPMGFMSSLTDKRGTVWMGSSDKGLWYYKDYQKLPTPANIKRINHPLLNTVNAITAMTIYKNWLVLSCYDRVCLFDLDSFYKKGKTIVRYLNQQEAALTSFTEQNTMLTSKTDSTVWFSTNDMLYQWDIKTWLGFPNYKVNVSTFLQHNSSRVLLNPKKTVSLEAGLNSFDLMFEYLSPDGLPRFTRMAMIKEGDRILFSEPGNQSQFTFKNQSSGNYYFYLEVFEQDGKVTRYVYNFIINKYFWQQWWFWVLCTFIVLIPVLLWLNTRRKKALMAKEISQLNVITLSGQFRPHFILNALNTIGADLKDKPLAESIISRLGESINLIFNQSQQKVVCHSLKNEWLLVENVIQIHRIMYLPDLEVSYIGNELLNEYEDLKVPLGILETNVENALLHGLRNKQDPPYSLSLSVKSDTDYFYFEIADNGIGRKAAIKLSSYKKHGTGIKNLNSIIDILNKYNKHKILIAFLDNQEEGTVVNIKIPKEYRYEY
ncbi:MAG: histidine kinase [Bacteroidota bacterium]